MDIWICSLILLVLQTCCVLSEDGVQTINIGAIFHHGDDELEKTFDQAISDWNNDMNTYLNLKPIKRIIEIDSYKTALTTCEIMGEGVAAIFGPKNLKTRNMVASITGRLNVPHIEYSYREVEDYEEAESIYVYPNSKSLENVIAQLVKEMNWHSFTYIYQTADALSRFQKALQNSGRDSYPITIRELPPLSYIKSLPTQNERDNIYEKLAKEIQLSTQYTILIDVENENLSKLLENLSKMNIMSDYFMCLILNLDASMVNIEEYILKDSVANITRLQFIRDESQKMSVEAALLYDSVFAFSSVINNLYKDRSFKNVSHEFSGIKIDCTSEATYRLGRNITKYFVEKTIHGKKTGLMTFSRANERNFELEIINIQAGRTAKVGSWKDDRLILHRNEKEINNTLTEAAKSKIFKVTTRIGPPYVMPVDDDVGGRSIGDRKYEGYCIDLIGKIEDFLGIKCEFEIVPDGNYGSMDPITKKWNGLIKQLLELKADFAICDLTITSERQSAVDFTAPFMNLGISILFSKSEKVVPKQFAFMDPLSTEVWMYTATAYLIVSLMLFFQARIAPGEWINPHPCNPDPEELENSFTLMNSMWLTMGSLMQQGSDILPRTPSIRMVAGIWWFFVLIMVSTYTANLAAFLTNEKMEDTIKDVEGLAKQTKVLYGSVSGASTYSFFKNSNTSLYQRIFNTMYDAKPSVFTKNNDEGVDRVIKGKRKYAFFMESTSIEYQIERHCELQMVGGLLDNKGYGIAMPPNSPYRTMISTAILHLQEKGELQQLKMKWWKEKGGGKCSEDSDEPMNENELGMPHVAGVFLVLLFGCVISIFIGLAEFLWNIRKVAIEEKISPCYALAKEVKFVINIWAIAKPVKSGKSSKSTSIQANTKEKSDSIHDSMIDSHSVMDTNNDYDMNEHEQ